MDEVIPQCVSCGKVRNLKPSGECFKCWIGNGPGIAWVGGGGYTRQSFHDSTTREAVQEELRGHDPTREYEPRHTKAYAWAPVK